MTRENVSEARFLNTRSGPSLLLTAERVTQVGHKLRAHEGIGYLLRVRKREPGPLLITD